MVLARSSCCLAYSMTRIVDEQRCCIPGRIAHEEPTLTLPKGHQVKNIKKFAVALAVSAIGFGLVPAGTSFAKGGGGGSTAPAPTQPSGGGTVAGPCGQMTSISVGNVTLSASGSGYTASPLQVRGTVFNCSIYLQQYYIVFDEPGNTNASCRANFALFGVLIINSGGSQSWSKSGSISPSGVTSTAGCVGTHTLRATLYDRSFGLVQGTAFLTYTVSA